MLTYTPEEVARNLVEDNYPVEKYRHGVQARRYERYHKFKQMNVPQAIIDKEQELIAHGERVMELMELAYAKTITFDTETSGLSGEKIITFVYHGKYKLTDNPVAVGDLFLAEGQVLTCTYVDEDKIKGENAEFDYDDWLLMITGKLEL